MINMTTTTMVERSGGEEDPQIAVLKSVGWDHMNEEERIKTVNDARELIVNKSKTLLASHDRMKQRIQAMRNTAIQCRRKADLLHGQARSLENTIRNVENRLTEDEARLIQITRAALILQATEANTP